MVAQLNNIRNSRLDEVLNSMGYTFNQVTRLFEPIEVMRDGFEKVGEAAHPLLKPSDRRASFLSAVKFGGLLGLPFTIAEIAKASIQIHKNKNKLDGTMTLIANIRGFIDSVGLTIAMVKEFAPLAEHTATALGQVAMPFSIVINALGLVLAGFHIKKAVQTEKAMKSFTLDSEKIEQNFGIKNFVSKNKERDLKAFKERLWSISLVHKLRATALIVSAIAATIILFTPVPFVGVGILAAIGVVHIGIFIYDSISERNMEKTLELPRNKWKDVALVIGSLSLAVIPGFIVGNLVK